MTKKEKKKLKEDDILIEYCSEDYEGDWTAMAQDSVNPEYETNAS